MTPGILTVGSWQGGVSYEGGTPVLEAMDFAVHRHKFKTPMTVAWRERVLC